MRTDKSTVGAYCFGLASLPETPGFPALDVSFLIHANKVVTLQKTIIAYNSLNIGPCPLLCFCLLLHSLHTKCIFSDPTDISAWEGLADSACGLRCAR